MKKFAFWITAVVGFVWIGIGLRDVFARHLFRFDGQVATNSTIVLDFVVGLVFLVAALSLRKAKSNSAYHRSWFPLHLQVWGQHYDRNYQFLSLRLSRSPLC